MNRLHYSRLTMLDIWLFKNVNTHNYFFFSVWIYLIICIRFSALWFFVYFSIIQTVSLLLLLFVFNIFVCFVEFCHVSECQSFIIVSWHCTTKKKIPNKSNICLLFRVYRLLELVCCYLNCFWMVQSTGKK